MLCVLVLVCVHCYRPGESLQEIINTAPPLATVMNDKAKMDTEVRSTTYCWHTFMFSLSFVSFVEVLLTVRKQ